MISEPTNAHVLCMYESILYISCNSYMFWSPILLSSGKSITKDRYIEIFQKFLNKCTNIKY